MRQIRLLCVSIEASGDRLLAHVLSHLKSHASTHEAQVLSERSKSPHLHLQFIGIGGPRSQAEGLESVIDPTKLAAHGLTEALSVLPDTLRAWRLLKHLARDVDAYFDAKLTGKNT